jgi:hypothetical protein
MEQNSLIDYLKSYNLLLVQKRRARTDAPVMPYIAGMRSKM